MRVSHIIDSGGFYGAEVMLFNLCIAQQALGIDVEVISIGTRNQGSKIIEEKLQAAGINVVPWRMLPLPNPIQALKIARHCRNNRTQIIHSHGYKGNILLGCLPSRLRKIPLITTLHGYTQRKGFSKLAVYQWLDRLFMKRLDAVVLVSPNMTHQVSGRVSADRLHVIPNGIPDASHTKSQQTYKSPFKQTAFKIGSLGRLSFEKNFSLLIQSMTDILKQIPTAQLVIFGEGPEREKLSQLINEQQLNEQISLPGYLESTADFFNEIQVFVNCSLTEGMPISILEAMRQGVPVVASDIPANRHLLELSGTTQYLFPLQSQGLVARLSALQQLSESGLGELTEKLRVTFKQHFTAASMAQRYFTLYDQLQTK